MATLVRSGQCSVGAACIALMTAAGVQADDPVMLQWFEIPWRDIERRAPDFFACGYGSVWLPPISRGASGTSSVGYDTFDRFDLGRPGSFTGYGSEDEFRAMVAALHDANGLVYIDTIMNHNSGRTESQAFHDAGGWPGFWSNPASPPRNKTSTDDWGDFHNGTGGGYFQSGNSGQPLYDLFRGDLVGLVDISQETDHRFIRQPIGPGIDNIPPGTVRNLPDPNNARFYPDTGLPAFTFTNPGTFRNPGAQSWSIHPYNTLDPMQGDPVVENATDLLVRWTQWMVDEFSIDGFRLDAAKHIPSWFWDTYWDSAVYLRGTAPDGSAVTPFSFVEAVDGNQWVYDNYVRKVNNNARSGDSFGNRDALDLGGAGVVRDLMNAGGFGTWASVVAGHIDNVDGYNDGTVGVNHVFSHDNGTTGDSSLPTIQQQGYTEHAYVLTRPGIPIVYHNARGMGIRSFPDGGVPVALGIDPGSGAPTNVITRLVEIHNTYGRGQFIPINHTDPVNQSMADVLIYERSSPVGAGRRANLLVGLNDREDAGLQERYVQTSFPGGTRLHELTGNAAATDTDPFGLIPEVLTVDPGGWVLIRIPNKVTNGGSPYRGYVAYGPATPSGTLAFSNVASTIPADPVQTPAAFRRLTSVPVIEADAFQIQLTTTQTDPLDSDTDDNAIFRIDQGYVDSNGDGAIDIPGGGVAGGYEQFLTVHAPHYNSGNPTGQYAQDIDATQLSEGFHYVSVLAFRRRDAGTDPLFTEFRQPVYIDREGPAVQLLDATLDVPDETHTFHFEALDRTATHLHVFWDLDEAIDPIPLANVSNQAARNDRFDWQRTLTGLTFGSHSLTLVAFEESGNASVTRYEDIWVATCAADFNGDRIINTQDFVAFLNAYSSGDLSADLAPDGILNTLDFIVFLNLFTSQCA